MRKFDAAVVGARFAGLYMIHRLRSLGFPCGHSRPGTASAATWYWNRYPGGHAAIEATQKAEDEWVAQVGEVADAALYPTCDSWYPGANVPGKPRVFMPCIGLPSYVKTCSEAAANSHEGFELS